MPSPRRENPDDFFARLDEHQKPHLTTLREISLEYADRVSEELRWNVPAYLHSGTNLWMLQAFQQHCSLRFTPAFFAHFIDEIEEAGYESGAGFLKLPYAAPIPFELCRNLIEARLAEVA